MNPKKETPPFPDENVAAVIVEPRISVIVPVFNAEATLTAQLEALANQTYGGSWELIVADNGSFDGSRRLAEEWIDRIPDMQIVDASERRGPSFARNTGAATARGELLAFCDADDVVSPDWLGALAEALEGHDFVVGIMDDASLNADLPALWRRRQPWSTDPTSHFRFLPCASSGNMAITRRVYEAVGGFSEDFARGEDRDFSWRVQLAGHPLFFASDAVVARRRRHSEAAIWRRHVGLGRGQVQLYKHYRRVGLPRSSWTGALRAYATLLLTWPKLLMHKERGAWLKAAATRWGRILGSIRERVLYL